MISSAVARRRPRPGDSRETASIRLVLPAPLGPWMRDGTAIEIEPRAPVAAKMREAQMGNMRGHGGVFLEENGTEKPAFPWGIAGNSGGSHAHRHHDIDRAQVVAFPHQRRLAEEANMNTAFSRSTWLAISSRYLALKPISSFSSP
jgi:hypothetical protein